MILGIDVSHWQGKLDWGKVKAVGITFGIAKAGEVPYSQITHQWYDYVDDMYSRNMIQMEEVGIAYRFAYYFYHPAVSAGRQAQNFYNICKVHMPNCIPILDVETNDNRTPAVFSIQLKLCIDKVTALFGIAPMIYTRNGIWVNQVGNPAWSKDYYFWLAQYPALTMIQPNIKDKVVIHQYSEHYKIPGIGGDLDGDYFIGKSLDDLLMKPQIIEHPPKPIYSNGIVVGYTK